MKFQRYYVTDGTHKARVSYSLDNHISGRKIVTLYEKDYSGTLSKIFADAKNGSDYQTDYVVGDIMRLFEDHPEYPAARARAEAIEAAKKA